MLWLTMPFKVPVFFPSFFKKLVVLAAWIKSAAKLTLAVLIVDGPMLLIFAEVYCPTAFVILDNKASLFARF